MNNELQKPLEPNEVEWRVQSSKDGKITVVPYLNNRCVMERFDAAFGADNWTSEFREITGGFICRLTVHYGNKVIHREDGAQKTDIEPLKGGISDSMKRCAVQFGLGRGLYSYPRVQIAGEGKFIPNWAYPKLSALVKWVNDGNHKDYILIENK
jgi:hypothetical protein